MFALEKQKKSNKAMNEAKFLKILNSNIRCLSIYGNHFFFLKPNSEAGERAEWLRAFTALAEDVGSVFSTYVRLFTTVCNSGSRASNTTFWPLWAPACTWYTRHACRQNTHLYT